MIVNALRVLKITSKGNAHVASNREGDVDCSKGSQGRLLTDRLVSRGAQRFPGGHQQGRYDSRVVIKRGLTFLWGHQQGSSTSPRFGHKLLWGHKLLPVLDINFSPCGTSTSLVHQLRLGSSTGVINFFTFWTSTSLGVINFFWGHQQGSSTSPCFGQQPPFWTSTSLGHQLLQILDISFSLLWTSTSLGHQTSLRLPKLLPTRHLGWKQIHYE